MVLNRSPRSEEDRPALALYMCYIMLCHYLGKKITGHS